MSTVTAVKSCAATTCAFNNGGCAAFAVTITGKADCSTFITLDARGGLPTASGQVGACQCLECVHNKDLMCTIDAIDVADGAACASYEVR
ncbi:DUF1540 domain-containing protein [Acidipropionibacterium virtanenii]|uniref:DUF1540 domain-containing protein n=1 Tax=Acidipropionibacterium virtanenii TaxID=2057246 RepID=A0A344US03_9ACTN|nr:DUF1540 domain-containing protein [Acidipropionibacterium virtanenii]AXE38051.1 hypothetical protein JS278_00864 [Acidipropionibacterium virtanenii]